MLGLLTVTASPPPLHRSLLYGQPPLVRSRKPLSFVEEPFLGPLTRNAELFIALAANRVLFLGLSQLSLLGVQSRRSEPMPMEGPPKNGK